MNVTLATRVLVLARDDHRCVSCRHGITGPLGYSLQHRTPRGMGGTKRPESNSPANLITLCGSATTGCHGWAEGNLQWSHRTEVLDWGYVVRRGTDPAEVPVLTADGWVLFDHDGYLTHVDLGADYVDTRRARDIRMGTKTGDRA